MEKKKRKGYIRIGPWKETARRDMNTIEACRGPGGAFSAYLLDEITEIRTVTAPGFVGFTEVRHSLVKRERIDVRDEALFVASGGTLGAMVRMAGDAVDGIVGLTRLREKLTEESKASTKPKRRKKAP